MEITYQEATLNELDEVTQLFVLATQEMEKNEIHQWDEIYPTRSELERDIMNREMMVGKIKDKIVVVYVINRWEDEQYKKGNWVYEGNNYRILHRLCVHPSYQKMGIARKTLNYIHACLIQDGIESIRLDAFTENPYSLRLYDKAGYQKVGTVDFRKGTFYIMEKVF